MSTFDVIATGYFSPEELQTDFDPVQGRMITTPETENWLDTNWQQLTEWGQKNGRRIHNGKMLRLVDCALRKKRLFLQLGLTDYREYVGTRQPAFFQGQAGKNTLANPLGTAAVIFTTDNKILCGRRPPNADVNPNKYFLVGGFLTPDDLHDSQNLFTGVAREIYEETNISMASLCQLHCTGLVYDRLIPHPVLCFSVQATETFDTIQNYKPVDDEIVKLQFINNTARDVADWILHLYPDEVVNTAAGCLLLHGLQTFGSDWFDEMLAKLI
ncbi:MAG: hypothetical protein Fur0021_27370 [Candidatus Promineifilaceae bacterium]